MPFRPVKVCRHYRSTGVYEDPESQRKRLITLRFEGVMAKWRRRSPSGDPPDRRRGNFDLPRFIKLCGMLASPNEGERASAALKASEMLKSADLTWHDVVKDANALLEHVSHGNAEDAEARAHRFWKTKGSPQHSQAQSDAT
jgi:hypothetical protein